MSVLKRETRKREADGGGNVAFQFGLAGLVVFSVSLMLGGGLVASSVLGIGARNKPLSGSGGVAGQANREQRLSAVQRAPPWGDLSTTDIVIERPEEYAAYETGTNQPPAWVFDKMAPEQARSLMLACGLDTGQVERALSPALCSAVPSGTVVMPDENLLFSLSQETRAKFYRELGRSDANHYMQYPFCFPADRLAQWFGNVKVAPDAVARIKKLLYPRGTLVCFSDFEFVLRGIPSDEQRLALVKALSRQPALLAHLHVGPETDVDRLLGYWGRGLQAESVRPLLEALRRQPQGDSISLIHLLPRFVRDRLYTYPLPPTAGDPLIDCHWTSMNFFNDKPDNRFADPAYTVHYLTTNFHLVAKPFLYGDVVMILDNEGNAIHSAVYLADDIVFTKNGNNFAQPWTLMRLKDLLPEFSGEGAGRTVVYRSKNS